jgi:hypothetical protein
MNVRDRVKELRRVRAGDLIPNERNWRTHPDRQKDALRGVLAEVGYADALIAYETPMGLKLIDGHLRAETTPDAEVPVLVLDVTDAEANKLLALLDPLAGLAEADTDALAALLDDVETDNASLQAVFDGLADANGLGPDEPEEEANTAPQLGGLEYRVIVRCADEQQQAALVARLEGEGFPCQPLMS